MHTNAYLHERNNESNYLTGSVLYIDFVTGAVSGAGIKGLQSQDFSILLIWIQTLLSVM